MLCFRLSIEIFNFICNISTLVQLIIMALAVKPGKSGLEETRGELNRIRITLSSKNVKNLEKGIPHCDVPVINLFGPVQDNQL